MKRVLIVAMVGLVVASCGSETGDTTTTIAATTTTQMATSTTAQPATSTTSEATTTSTAPAPDIVISGGTADDPISIQGPDLFSVGLGDEVLIRIQSATAGELHVHGYDLYFDLVAGGVTEVEFSAEIPGIFEAELEGTHTLVFEIEVAP